MDQQKFQYPEGMDKVVEDYTKQRWCFVAVKTRVGNKAAVDPQPGQRKIDSRLPAGGFEGSVQAMGFRFRSREPVLPMRLSAFNQGELRNVVYLLTNTPRKILNIPEEYVVRQVSGKQLIKNLTEPLPVRLIGARSISRRQLKPYDEKRDPTPHNRVAGELFLSDCLAASSRKLISESEQLDKELLNVGEHLGLRGGEYDRLIQETREEKQKKFVKLTLAPLRSLTLTVIDGDFPRHVLARENLSFSAYNISPRKNRVDVYDSKLNGRPGNKKGLRLSEADLDRFLQSESQGQHAGVESALPEDSRSVFLSDFYFGMLALVLVGCVCVLIGTPRSINDK